MSAMVPLLGVARLTSIGQLRQLSRLAVARDVRLLRLSGTSFVEVRLKSDGSPASGGGRTGGIKGTKHAEPTAATEKKSVATNTEQESTGGGQLQRSILEEVLTSEKKKPTTFAGKAAEKATNTFMYVAVAAGVGLIGVFVYLLAGEFFAEDSPQKIFSNALDRIRDDGRCQDLFGATIKGYGEETSRGRRRHVAHHKYEKDGHQRIRVLFHLKGERAEGLAQAEMEMRDGNWEWRFLYVETKGRPKDVHVLIDNR